MFMDSTAFHCYIKFEGKKRFDSTNPKMFNAPHSHSYTTDMNCTFRSCSFNKFCDLMPKMAECSKFFGDTHLRDLFFKKLAQGRVNKKLFLSRTESHSCLRENGNFSASPLSERRKSTTRSNISIPPLIYPKDPLRVTSTDDVKTAHSSNISVPSGLSELSRPPSNFTDDRNLCALEEMSRQVQELKQEYRDYSLASEQEKHKTQIECAELTEQLLIERERTSKLEAQRKADKKTIKDLLNRMEVLERRWMDKEEKCNKLFVQPQARSPKVVPPNEAKTNTIDVIEVESDEETKTSLNSPSIDEQTLIKSLKSLNRRQPLNDFIINKYIEVSLAKLNLELSEDTLFTFYDKVHIEDTYFMTRLRSNYDFNHKRYTSPFTIRPEKIQKLKKSIVIIPVNSMKGQHWSIMCILLPQEITQRKLKGKVFILDSYDPTWLSEEVQMYNTLLSLYILKAELELVPILLPLSKQLPDTNDCGVFCLEYIDCALRHLPFSFDAFLDHLTSIKAEDKAQKRDQVKKLLTPKKI